jgi:hypothetical protein
MSARHRDGIRDLDNHASWREVYTVLDVDPDQHEQEVVYE